MPIRMAPYIQYTKSRLNKKTRSERERLFEKQRSRARKEIIKKGSVRDST
jgi:hypothetical protein